MKRFVLMILAVMLLLIGAQAGPIQPVRDGFNRKVMEATLALYGQLDWKTQMVSHFLCSASVIGRDQLHRGYFLLSAGHCVANEPAEVTFAVADDMGGKLTPVTPVKAILEPDKAIDYSLWYFPTTKKYPVMKLGDESTEHVGDEEINANFTQGLIKQLSFGQISSDVMGSAVERCRNCAGYFLVQEQAGPGASGSAIISKRTHKIVGILVIETGGGFGVEPISTITKNLKLPDEYKKLHVMSDED